MIRIHQELHIRMDEGWDQTTVTLWLVAYGAKDNDTAPHDRMVFFKALSQFCDNQGWLLEAGTDEEWEGDA